MDIQLSYNILLEQCLHGLEFEIDFQTHLIPKRIYTLPFTLSILSALGEFCYLYKPQKGKKFLIIWDNAAWHKKAAKLIETDETYNTIKEKVEIMFLPPYSPDLNPIEQVWRKARREVTHNRFFKSMEEKAIKLDKWFQKFEKPNNELKSLIDWAV